MIELNLIPDEIELIELALEYEYNSKVEIEELKEIGETVKNRKYLTYNELLILSEWKSPRNRRNIEANNEKYIEEVTKFCFESSSEQLRIEILTLLNGVNFPMASVILHFCHEDQYPILDFRALEAFGVERGEKYNFELWNRYTRLCRSLAANLNVDMRTIDKGLWQYSKSKASQ